MKGVNEFKRLLPPTVPGIQISELLKRNADIVDIDVNCPVLATGTRTGTTAWRMGDHPDINKGPSNAGINRDADWAVLGSVLK